MEPSQGRCVPGSGITLERPRGKGVLAGVAGRYMCMAAGRSEFEEERATR